MAQAQDDEMSDKNNTIQMSWGEVWLLIQKSIEMKKYDNARNILEDIIKEHEKQSSNPS